jgi:hypothetical protein
MNEQVTPGDIAPGDRIGDRTVLWVIYPARPGVHELVPNGGALVTFTDGTQAGYR